MPQKLWPPTGQENESEYALISASEEEIDLLNSINMINCDVCHVVQSPQGCSINKAGCLANIAKLRAKDLIDNTIKTHRLYWVNHEKEEKCLPPQ